MDKQTSSELEQFGTVFADVSVVIVKCLQMLREVFNVGEGDRSRDRSTLALVTHKGGQLLEGDTGLWPPSAMHQSLVKVEEAGIVKHPATLLTRHSCSTVDTIGTTCC